MAAKLGLARTYGVVVRRPIAGCCAIDGRTISQQLASAEATEMKTSETNKEKNKPQCKLPEAASTRGRRTARSGLIEQC